MRVLRMGDQRDAGSPEGRILLGAGDLLAELGREFAMDRGCMDADLFEDAPVHEGHYPSPARTLVALPRGALKTSRRARGQGAAHFVLDLLEGSADAVAKLLEPGLGLRLLVFDRLRQAGGDIGTLHNPLPNDADARHRRALRPSMTNDS